MLFAAGTQLIHTGAGRFTLYKGILHTRLVPDHITAGVVFLANALCTKRVTASGQFMRETAGCQQFVGGRQAITGIQTIRGGITDAFLPRSTFQTIHIPRKQATIGVSSADTILTNRIHTSRFLERHATRSRGTIQRRGILRQVGTTLRP